MFGLYYNGLLASIPTTASAALLFFFKLLMILLEEYQLVKLCERLAEPEVVADPGNCRGSLEFFFVETIKKVLFKLVYGY
jgi:hypothetical protein